MAYNRRNDNEGRVVGFKDGMPVYKRGSSGPSRTTKGGDRKPRYNDRDKNGEYDSRGDYSGKRTYNRKNEPQKAPYPRRGESDRGRTVEVNRPRDNGRFDRGTEPYRRSESFRTDSAVRPGSRNDRIRAEGRPHDTRSFGNEGIDRHAEEMRRIKPAREERRYGNIKALPSDIAEKPVSEEELPNIIMGRNPVKEAIKAGRSIDRILVTKEHDGSLNEILDLAYDAKLVVRDVDRAKLDEICMPFGHNGRTGNHQGIIAYIPGVEYCELSDILDCAKEKGEDPFVILLDGVEDPHNLGSVIRSAECAGAHGVVITKRRSASVTAAVIKTSAGATEHMNIAKVVNLSVAIERLKEAGVWVACADMEGDPLYKADLRGPFALVVGAEGAGVSRLVKEKCDFSVSIPLKGEIGSLNASVAAAVVMFEKVRQELS